MQLRDYRQAVLDILELPTVPKAIRQSSPPPADVNRWFVDRWQAIARGRMGQGYLAKETIEDLLRGKHPRKRVHLEVMHRVLHLNAYGLNIDELWIDPKKPDELRDLEDFKQSLRNARKHHVDPLHHIRAKAQARLALRVEAAPATGPSLMIAEAETKNGAEELPPPLIIKRGSPFTVRVVPQVAGMVLVISHIVAEKRAVVLNEHMDHPRTAIVPAYEPFVLPRKNATGDAGEREIIVVNWPEKRSLAVANLDGLFERRDPSISEHELRNIGAELLESENGPDDRRVASGLQRIRLVP